MSLVEDPRALFCKVSGPWPRLKVFMVQSHHHNHLGQLTKLPLFPFRFALILDFHVSYLAQHWQDYAGIYVCVQMVCLRYKLRVR